MSIEQWVVGSRNMKTGEELNLQTTDHAGAVAEYERRAARSAKSKKPHLNHFYRKATA
jgi:hypothetical protein